MYRPDIAHNFETRYTMQKDKLIKTDAERDLGIVTTSNMRVSAQCSNDAIKAMQILRLIKQHFSHIDREDFRRQCTKASVSRHR